MGSTEFGKFVLVFYGFRRRRFRARGVWSENMPFIALGSSHFCVPVSTYDGDVGGAFHAYHTI